MSLKILGLKVIPRKGKRAEFFKLLLNSCFFSTPWGYHHYQKILQGQQAFVVFP